MCEIYNHVYIWYRKVEVKLSRETKKAIERKEEQEKDGE